MVVARALKSAAGAYSLASAARVRLLTKGMVSADARDEMFRKLNDANSGWNAVAVGSAGRPGLSLKAATEQNAINEALANCVRSDSDCHVIAIGPFAVGPN